MTPREQYMLDLVVRGRRGELDANEERALQGALQTSTVARSLYQAGIGFDAESPVRPGDEQLLARLADQVGAKVGRPPSRRWWRIALPPAAASLVAATAAASAWFAFGHSAKVTPTSDSCERPAPAPPSGRPESEERVSSEPAAAPSVRPPSSARFGAASPSASELFARARPFVVEAGGAAIYLGAFMTLVSSVAYDVPTVMVENIAPDGFAIGIPSSATDPRNDPRIVQALSEIGKYVP